MITTIIIETKEQKYYILKFFGITVASPPSHPTTQLIQSASSAKSDFQACKSAELKETLAKYIQTKRKLSPEFGTDHAKKQRLNQSNSS